MIDNRIDQFSAIKKHYKKAYRVKLIMNPVFCRYRKVLNNPIYIDGSGTFHPSQLFTYQKC